MRACWHYSSKGSCRFGNSCNFAHAKQGSTTGSSAKRIELKGKNDVNSSGQLSDDFTKNTVLRCLHGRDCQKNGQRDHLSPESFKNIRLSDSDRKILEIRKLINIKVRL